MLRSVFDAGSPPLRADAAALRGYRRRAYVVSGVRMHFLRIRMVGGDADLVRLRVVDRLGAATVHGPDLVAQTLPTDRPSSQLITLTATARGYRIAAVDR